MISINEYLLSKKNAKARLHDVIANDDNIEEIVHKAIRDYGTGVDLNFIDTSAVTKMNSLFDQEDFEGDVSRWDVSNVTTMNYMFNQCQHFNCNLSKWNTEKVIDMNFMFANCFEFDGEGIEDWDVSEVYDMRDMFFNCFKLNPDLSKWDLDKLEDSSRMFKGCKIFEGKGLNKWVTPKLERMVEMFSDCDNFDVDLSHWHVKRVTHWSYFAYGTPIYKKREKWPKFI